MVTGKADQGDTLPLPANVGQALADYVRYGRARTSCRHLFITVRAPFTKLAVNTSISGIVERACQRAGIPPFGPHRLRHAVACDLLADGASLTEIGQLLRHRSQRATAIYANPLPEDVIASAVAYFQRRGQPAHATPAPGTEPGAAPVYDPASLRVLFGTDGS